MSGLTIGKVASAAGVHVETVRYYERRGLLEQPSRQPGSAYREYSDDDVWRLQLIGRAKQLGFTLAEIGELLGDSGGRSNEAVLAAARAKLASVAEQERALAELRVRLERLTDACASGDGGCLTFDVVS